MKFKTQYNATPSIGEINNEPSMTVPDQTLSMKDILRRFRQGLPITGAKAPVFDDDGSEEYFPDLSKMDLADRQQAIEDAQVELASLKTKIEEEKKQKAQVKTKPAKKKKEEPEEAEVIEETDSE